MTTPSIIRTLWHRGKYVALAAAIAGVLAACGTSSSGMASQGTSSSGSSISSSAAKATAPVVQADAQLKLAKYTVLQYVPGLGHYAVGINTTDTYRYAVAVVLKDANAAKDVVTEATKNPQPGVKVTSNDNVVVVQFTTVKAFKDALKADAKFAKSVAKSSV